MTSDDMRIILEHTLHIPIYESDAAFILASVEKRLENGGGRQVIVCAECGEKTHMNHTFACSKFRDPFAGKDRNA